VISHQPELNFFGDDARFHHIGMAVPSIREVSPDSRITKDEIQNVFVSFVSLNGVNIELIEPEGTDSPILLSLKKGIKLVHICYEVDDIEEALKECRKHRFHCIARPQPAAAFNNNKIAWIYSRHYGLFELLEKQNK
jgi:methylmalonyl-CoA/ethylmalonyl-CoA epimerase